MTAYSDDPDEGVQDVQAHALGSDLSFDARPSPGTTLHSLRGRKDSLNPDLYGAVAVRRRV
jgi:hypothetical protein